ncbi:MAG TPA: hypothetical protein VEH04_04325 [Verrucomicrobiae bacterium]|nr:hypothetical protein [Verrucomicrobiae bacterium]
MIAITTSNSTKEKAGEPDAAALLASFGVMLMNELASVAVVQRNFHPHTYAFSFPVSTAPNVQAQKDQRLIHLVLGMGWRSLLMGGL